MLIAINLTVTNQQQNGKVEIRPVLKVKEIDSQLEKLELSSTSRNSIHIQALNNAKESLIIPMPSPKTKEMIGKILNKPEEMPTKKKRGRKQKNKEATGNDGVTTNDTPVGEKVTR